MASKVEVIPLHRPGNLSRNAVLLARTSCRNAGQQLRRRPPLSDPAQHTQAHKCLLNAFLNRDAARYDLLL
jgi:hypothetical protein